MAPKGNGNGNGKGKGKGKGKGLAAAAAGGGSLDKKQKNVVGSSSKSNNVVRIWKEEDEKILLEALVQYHHQNQCLPHPNNYASFLSNLGDPFFSFQPDPSQLCNKIRVFQRFYKKQKKNPQSVKEGHNRLVYEMCHKLFGKGDDGLAADEDDGVAADEDDGNYTNLLQLKDEAAMQLPRLSYMEDQEFIRLLGLSMARKYEDDLIEIKNSITKLKMKEFRLRYKIFTTILR